jgi:uncharacterized caspase-like protein
LSQEPYNYGHCLKNVKPPLRQIFSFLIVALFSCSLLYAQTSTTGRYALVIGNASYKNTTKLKKPLNDASDVAASLQKLGWNVTLKTDLGRYAMQEAVNTFITTLSQNSQNQGCFYYAGHGMAIDGQNYLLPVDVNAATRDYVQMGSLSLDDILALFGQAGNSINVAVIDA